MEPRKTASAQENTLAFATRLLELERQKKIIQEDVKALKEEFSEEGVPVKIVTQAINQIKRQKKMSDGEIFELESIKEWLLSSREVDDKIGDLVSSD